MIKREILYAAMLMIPKNMEPEENIKELLTKQRQGKFLTPSQKQLIKNYAEDQRIKKLSQKKKKR